MANGESRHPLGRYSRGWVNPKVNLGQLSQVTESAGTDPVMRVK